MARDSRRGRTPAAGGTLAPRQDTTRARMPATAGRTRPRWVSLLLRCLAAARWILMWLCNMKECVLPTHVLLTKQQKSPPPPPPPHFHFLPTIISSFFGYSKTWKTKPSARWCEVSIVVFKSLQAQIFRKLAQVFHWTWILICLDFASVPIPALLQPFVFSWCHSFKVFSWVEFMMIEQTPLCGLVIIKSFLHTGVTQA